MKRTSGNLLLLVIGAALALGTSAAQAGPCTAGIARLEVELRAARGTPEAGPSGPQSIGAQMEHQPTPDSVALATKEAQARFDAVLTRAKTLDAQNDPACADALAEARTIYFE